MLCYFKIYTWIVKLCSWVIKVCFYVFNYTDTCVLKFDPFFQLELSLKEMEMGLTYT